MTLVGPCAKKLQFLEEQWGTVVKMFQRQYEQLNKFCWQVKRCEVLNTLSGKKSEKLNFNLNNLVVFRPKRSVL